jgi:hypothetical protein
MSADLVDPTSTLQTALQLAEEYGMPVFPCRADKRPYTEHGFKEATRNVEQIAEWWARWPDALIGVPTGRASRLIAVDIDPDGIGWYTEHAEQLGAGRTHRTRRDGYHVLYRNPATEIRNSAGLLAAGVDVRGEGGYIIWWPAHGCQAVGDLEDLTEVPAWLLEQLARPQVALQASPSDGRKVPSGQRNSYLSREAFRLRKQGADVDGILQTLRALNDTRLESPLPDEELLAIAAGKGHIEPDAPTPIDTRPESLTLDEMLKRFVHVAKGPIIVDLANTYRRMRPGEFSAAYAHNKVVIEKKAVPTTVLWAQSERRMLADCMTFHPGEGQFYTERGMCHFNIWTAPDWPPVDTAMAAPFCAHLEYLIPDRTQREDLLDWLAHAVQRPEVRPHFHFLLVAAQEGTGRSWLVEVLRRLWGERHAGETDLHRLLDDSFNSVLSAKVLMAVHEVKAPADERYSHRDRLKGLLTDTSIRVNEKHEPKWTERFCARFLMFTNRDDALPLSETDRRVYVIRCADEPRDATYYTTLYGHLEDQEFLAAVWHLLRSREISGFNPGRRAPLNEMKEQMIAAGRTDEQQTAVEFVRACPHDVIAACDLVQVLVQRDPDEHARDHKARIAAMAAALKEIGCQTQTKKIWLAGESTRVWVLRNATRWSQSSAALRQAAERTHADIVAGKFSANLIIDIWKQPT